MTMQHQIHPDPERLAALAGNDPDASADVALREHMSSCDACRSTVDDIATLRTALSELPDLVPSRRLQLIPPVAEPKASSAGGGWLRRLAAPIMAAGFGLVLVGAIGTSGMGIPMGGSAGSSQPLDDRAGAEVETGHPAAATDASSEDGGLPLSGQSAEEQSRAAAPSSAEVSRESEEISVSEFGGRDDDASAGLFADDDSRLPWLVVLGLGVGLLASGIYLRFSLRPSGA
jgi:hypothetical protein